MMKKLLLAIALMLPVLAGAKDIETINREWSNMEITVGQKFWDGNMRYEVSEITPDGTFIFAGQTFETQKGIADVVDVLRLKKTAQPGKYILTQNSSLPSPFRCQWGAEVKYIRQNGMNFLAVKNSKGQIVETLVLTPDGIESLNAQQQQMEQDLLSDFEGMCDAMLMNTHMLVTLDYEVVRVGAMRLAKVKNPDIITKTNAQLLQSEWDYREGKAEGGYDNPDGLGGDGRGADEDAATPTAVSIPSTAGATDIETISREWSKKVISDVPTAGLGIMLERFDMTWPTATVGDVCQVMQMGVAKKVLDPDDGYTVEVDAKNGYAVAYNEGSDREYMSACVWNRSNGHKLLAVNLGKPCDPDMEFVCFYDYDPQKMTLTPEPELAEMLTQRFGYTQISYSLPRQGKDMKVSDYNNGGEEVYVFTWDGMRPVFSHMEQMSEEAAYIVPVNFKGTAPNVKDFVEAILSNTDEEDESMNGLKGAWKCYTSGMKQRPGRSLTVDTQNGFVGFESTDSYDGNTWRQVIEVCYWNYADKKHKLVAVSIDDYRNGQPEAGQFGGVTFYQYDNATRKMQLTYAQDLGLTIDPPAGTNGVSHELPRQGKTIVFNYHIPSGKIAKRLTWNGSKFIKE